MNERGDLDSRLSDETETRERAAQRRERRMGEGTRCNKLNKPGRVISIHMVTGGDVPLPHLASRRLP